MSQTLAARTACFDIVDGAWLTPLLRDCSAPPLPPVLAGGTVLGPVVTGSLLGTGVIDARTRVAVGGHDHPMAASLVCSLYPGAALDSMGTAELVYVEGPAPGPMPRNTLFAASLPIQGEAVAWLGVFELSSALDPILAVPGPMRDLFERVMAGEAIAAPPGGEGLRFLPWLGPNQLPEAAPTPLRLQAILEGCAMMTRRLLEEAAVLTGPLSTIFVAGGWARSKSFLQLRSDVLGRTLHRATEPQLSALGSAMLAARGCGASTPIAALASDIVAPVRDHLEFYDTLYESYRPSIEAHFCRPVGTQQQRPAP
jgi:xylulokinase